MKKSFTLFLLFFLLSFSTYPAIRRVNYNTNYPLANVDYTSFADAVNAAVAGDTIQIYGSVSTYGLTGIAKRLTIQGFGYNFDVHPDLQVNSTNQPSVIDTYYGFLRFLSGSENSVVEGISFVGYNGVVVQASNITLRRCIFYDWSVLYFENSSSDVNITQCVITRSWASSNPTSVSNLSFYNCILNEMNFSTATSSSIKIINCVTSAYPQNWSFSSNQVLVENSIITTYNSANVNAVYNNNFFSTAQPSPLPLGSNNRWGQNWGDLFDRLGGASDDPGNTFFSSFDELYFVLKTGSAAINGGFNASNNPTDCGIFGGEAAYRYKISGMPAIPSTYLLTAPGTSAASNPYNVTISVKSQN